jgi:hypothetical protein
MRRMSRCVVLTPVGGGIEPQCEESLRELERRGYAVWRVRGFSQIDVARSQLATDALHEGFTETMWIDSDMAFRPDDVDRLRRHNLPITCGIYPKKARLELAAHLLPGTRELQFGDGGGLLEIRYAATGFLHVRKDVYEKIATVCELPRCNERFGKPLVPYFQPFAIADPMSPPESGAHWYLGEDYAFCERARRAGFAIMADTTIRLGHVGSYIYSWEDAASSVERYSAFHYRIRD